MLLWSTFTLCSIAEGPQHPFGTVTPSGCWWFSVYHRDHQGCCFLLWVAVRRFKRMFVTHVLRFYFDFCMFNSRCLIFVYSQACWCDKLKWGLLAAAWAKHVILVRLYKLFKGHIVAIVSMVDHSNYLELFMNFLKLFWKVITLCFDDFDCRRRTLLQIVCFVPISDRDSWTCQNALVEGGYRKVSLPPM